MSQADVKFVLGLQPGPSVDVARLFRNDDRWATFTETASPFYHSDFETAGTLVGIERSGTGMEGFRTFWLDWLAPWATYRTEPEEAIDFGERVLVLSHSFGRLEGSTQEVKEAPAAVWTVRDGKIARVDLYLDRAEALKAVGIEEQAVSHANVENALRTIEAWNLQDLAAFIDTWHPEAEWRPAFPKATEGTGNVFRGHEGIEEAWRNVREAWDEYRVEADDARIVGESLLVLGRIYARGARSGIEIDSDWSAVVRFKDGKAISAWDWLDHAPALKAVGLEE